MESARPTCNSATPPHRQIRLAYATDSSRNTSAEPTATSCSENQPYLELAPWIVLGPAGALVLLSVLAVSATAAGRSRVISS